MSCECYRIGGPFIGADPNCLVHAAGGTQDQLEEKQNEIDSLQCEMAQMKEVINNLRDRVSDLEHRLGVSA